MSEDGGKNRRVRFVSRRQFLGGVAASLPLAHASSIAEAQETSSFGRGSGEGSAFPGVIVRQKNPLNAEYPFPTLDSYLTPNERFYIRTHFEVPEINSEDWRLKVEGEVENPLEIGLTELMEMEPVTMTSILECSGNSRVFLEPPQVSIRWEQGGVGNAEWIGVPLAPLLEKAGVKNTAVEVILEGFDKGKFEEPNAPTPGEVHYARSLALEKARRPEVILAYKMNGEDLPPEHGYPVRAVVGGWYGMASVKWLRRIIVTDRPFQGYFQTFAYSIWERRHDGLPTLVPVTEIEVKSQIARPMLHEVIPSGKNFQIFGAAWAGEQQVQKVEISTDGGNSWSQADLGEESTPFGWRFFHLDWETPRQTGRRILMARATDSSGNVQPMNRDEDRRNAVINHVQEIEVFVGG